MQERWFCADCRIPTGLNVFGRCEHCDSDAVDSMERRNLAHNIVKDLAAGSESFEMPQYAGVS
jgi:hypothetical protein